MTPVSVTLPVFVTVNVYGTTCPAAVIDVVVDVFTTFSDGVCADRDVQRVGVRRRLGRSPSPCCDRLPPASISACVTVCDARVDPGLATAAACCRVGVTGRAADRRRALRIRHRHTRQRHVARVRHRERVRHHLPGSRDRRRRRRLHHVAAPALWLTGMFNVSVSGADSVESAVTVFDRFPPASISACVTVWRAGVDPRLADAAAC